MEEIGKGLTDLQNELIRVGYAMLGVLLNLVRTLWFTKNRIDLLPNKQARKSAWREYWRTSWEDGLVAAIASIIFVLVLDVMVLVYDAWQDTNYDAWLDDNYVGYGVSFLIGLFALKIMEKLFTEVSKKL